MIVYTIMRGNCYFSHNGTWVTTFVEARLYNDLFIAMSDMLNHKDACYLQKFEITLLDI